MNLRFPNELVFKGERFHFVKTRRHGKVRIYGSQTEFLRVGEPDTIQEELNAFRLLTKNNFPIPRLITQGRFHGDRYYLESSLGKKQFTNLFAEDIVAVGRIRRKTFRRFLSVSKAFAEAQLSTRTPRKSFSGFKRLIHLRIVMRERPRYASLVHARYEQAESALRAYPCVFTHGDFNPHNLYPKGAIDLENFTYGPAGYDVVTNIAHIGFFPARAGYEFRRAYQFTKLEKREYLRAMDALYAAHGLPSITPNLEHFEFCRALWSAARMNAWPKVQKFRYELLFGRFLRRV